MREMTKSDTKKNSWSLVDVCICLYGLFTVLSFVVSDYRQTALYGHAGQYMGLVTQILLVWGYFLVSRFYNGEKLLWWLLGGAGVVLIMMENYGQYHGGVELVLPMMLYLFWNEKDWKRNVGAFFSVIGLFTLFTGGDAGTYISLGAVMLVLCWYSLESWDGLIRFLQTIVLVAVVPVVIAEAAYMIPQGMDLVEDDIVYGAVFWNGWFFVLVAVLFLLVAAYVWRKGGGGDFLQNGRLQKKFGNGAVSALIMTGLVILMCQLIEPVWQLFGSKEMLAFDEDWGSGRGTVWRVALQCFQQGSWREKLFGYGPDCFAEAVEKGVDLGSQLQKYVRTQKLILENAQNEWLNLLVTGGIAIGFSYVGICIGVVKDCLQKIKKYPQLKLGVLMMTGYLVGSVFRCHSVIEAGSVFLLLGMLEGMCSERKSAAESGTEKNEKKQGVERQWLVWENVNMEDNGALYMEEYLELEEKEVVKYDDEMGCRRTGPKGKRMQRLAIFSMSGVIAAVLCLGYSGYLLVDLFSAESLSEAKMTELRESVMATAGGIVTDENVVSGAEGRGMAVAGVTMIGVTEHTEGMHEKGLTAKDYATIFEQNEDMEAWLYIEDTKINYPVMQTPEDENFYLYRDFYGEEDKAGCLILDTDSSLHKEGTTNLIIHGHNMKSGIMFGELDKYKEEAYGKEHGRIKLFLKEEERYYEVISVFYSQIYRTTDITFKYYNFFEADTEEEFQYFYDNIKKLSLYDTGVEAELGDCFLTLSTCSYHTEDGRFVVVAKEIQEEF